MVRDEQTTAVRRDVFDAVDLRPKVAAQQKLAEWSDALFVRRIETEIVDLLAAVAPRLAPPLLLEIRALRDPRRRSRSEPPPSPLGARRHLAPKRRRSVGRPESVRRDAPRARGFAPPRRRKRSGLAQERRADPTNRNAGARRAFRGRVRRLPPQRGRRRCPLRRAPYRRPRARAVAPASSPLLASCDAETDASASMLERGPGFAGLLRFGAAVRVAAFFAASRSFGSELRFTLARSRAFLRFLSLPLTRVSPSEG